MATMHFHKAKTCVSFKNIIFRIKGVTWSNLAPIRNCPKGERMAKLDEKRSIGHLLTICFVKSAYFR